MEKDADDKKSFLSSLDGALLEWREKAYEEAVKFSSFTQARECLVGLEWGLLLHYANSEYRSKEPEFVYNSERRMCHFRLKQDAPTGTTFYWEHPTYTQAWQHYKAQEWAKAKAQFQALKKAFAKEGVLDKAVEICDLMLGNYVWEEEKK